MQNLSSAQFEIIAEALAKGQVERDIHARTCGRRDTYEVLVEAGLLREKELPRKGIKRYEPTRAAKTALEVAIAEFA